MKERIHAIIAHQLGVSPGKGCDDTRLVDDLGADSLALVELVMELETEFGVEIADDVAEKRVGLKATVQDVVQLMQELTA